MTFDVASVATAERQRMVMVRLVVLLAGMMSSVELVAVAPTMAAPGAVARNVTVRVRLPPAAKLAVGQLSVPPETVAVPRLVGLISDGLKVIVAVVAAAADRPRFTRVSVTDNDSPGWALRGVSNETATSADAVTV